MKIKEYFLLLTVAICSACQVPAQTGSDVTILKRSSHCSVSEPTFTRLQSIDEIIQVFAPDGHQVAQQLPPGIDLSKQAVMLLAMGERPSAGYGIELDSNPRRIDSDTLKLRVTFNTPDGGLAASVITNPCLIFSISLEGWNEIIAGDTGLTYSR
jgi:hypothetical protein